MIPLTQDRTKTLLAIHGWSGITLGLLLYAVILTGVIAVFAREITGWSSPLQAESAQAFPPGLDARIAELSTQVDPKFLEDVSVFPHAGGRVQVFFHHHVAVEGKATPEDFGVEFDLHPQTLAVMDRREGFGDDIHARNVAPALADFLVELHVSLHIPDPWGLFVTGVLGLAMLVAAVTGLLVHRHLFKELFTLRRYREALLARRDAHVIAGTWNLPFAFILAFTGSYFSFAGSVGIPAMAQVAFGGDQLALIETVFGAPRAVNEAPAAPASLDAVVVDAGRRLGISPTFVSIEHYGRADAQMSVFTPAREGELFFHSLVYNGATGAFERERPGMGQQPSTGGTLATLMGPLHFGNFAGVLSKGVWFALGFAGCYVALTGMLLWTTRRRESRAWQRMARAVTWFGYGLPLALAASGWGFFWGRAAGASELEAPMTTGLLGSALVSALIAFAIRDADRLRRLLLGATGLALLGLPLLRWALGGPGWISAIAGNLPTVPSLDLALLIGGALCLRAAVAARSTVARPQNAVAEDAELVA